MRPNALTSRSRTETYHRIWETVRLIPKGFVTNYGTVARLAGFPGQSRLCGYSLHALPRGTDVPWHRVINARGEISLPGDSGERQRALLEAEGIHFHGKKIGPHVRVWYGPSALGQKQALGARRQGRTAPGKRKASR